MAKKLLKKISGKVKYWVPGWLYGPVFGKKLAAQYKYETELELDLKHPKRFTEKIQWRKLYDRDPAYTILTDKYAVREWVERKVGSQYLIPLLGEWDDPDKIPFDELPDSFVLKTNHGSSMNILVTDKKKMDRKAVIAKLKKWMKTNYCFHYGYEMQYKPIKPKVVAEKFLTTEDSSASLTDYKFFCFHGKPMYCQVIREVPGRPITWMNMDWTWVGNVKKVPLQYNDPGKKPDNWNELVSVAEKLSAGFAFVRMDLYNINGHPYFSEMTFTPASGFICYQLDWDDHMGELWHLDQPQVDKKIVWGKE